MDKREPISMYRKLLGYRSGNRKQPVFAPMPGALVTRALIHCSQCRAEVSPDMGPHRDTWCIPCTEKGEVKAKEKGEQEREAEEQVRREKRKAEKQAREEREQQEKNRQEGFKS